MRKNRVVGLTLLCLLTFASMAVLASGPAPAPGLTADEALKMLKEGNARYVEGKPQHPRQSRERRALTAGQGQHPVAAVLSCSDSRAPVELIFDQGIGDIFVVRVAGNVAAGDESASVEYAVDHLGVPLVVVMGHTQCGAVTAVVENAKVQGLLAQLLAPIKPATDKARTDNPGVSGDALVTAAVKANVFQAMADLLQKSQEVRNRVKAGKAAVLGALYEIDTGQVQWLGPHPEQAKFLGPAGKTPPPAKAKKPAKAKTKAKPQED